MCRSRRAALASQPQPARRNHHQHPSASSRRTTAAPSSRRSTLPTTSGSVLPSTNLPTASTTPPLTDTNTHNKPSTTSASSSSSASSTLSLASIRTSLTDDKPVIYSAREIQKATNNFLASRLSPSTASASWRCIGLRGKDTVVFQRALRGNPRAVKARLEDVCRSHHGSLVRLLGASVGGTDTVFLVYEYVRGASLVDCLRNPRNPDFTLLPTWKQRMQIAADVAQGIEYIHYHSAAGAAAAADAHTSPSSSAQTPNGSGPLPRGQRRRRPPVHNRIKATSIMVFEQEPAKTEEDHAKAPKEPVFRAKICHFGASAITGELLGPEDDDDDAAAPAEGPDQGTPKRPTAKAPRRMKIEGTRGYMAPELLAGSTPSQKSDVYAFGVVLLELLSGEEPLRYTYAGSDLTSVSLVDTARDVLGSDDAGDQWDEDERRSRLRRWVDRRLRDSYPLDVADKVLQVAVQCVAKDPVLRPDMVRVAGKMSKLFILSQQWAKRVKPPTDFSISMAPR